MKCPSCGMNIRDDTLVCGYCGEEIPRQAQKSDSPGRQYPGGAAQKDTGLKGQLSDEDENGDEAEEGGLTPYLQSGEQVLIGSLNVSVKKFFFHAYLTDRRIFLIDTQEKKLKVTAKDVPRNTLAGCISEFSENSDPVLVLSIRSPDDEIKTMKIVFVQNGMDRSDEIDEWLALLQKEEKPVTKRTAAAPQPVPEPEPEEEPAFIELETPPQRAPAQELRPARKPVKHPEKQPPVKRLVSFSRAPEEEVLNVPPAQPQRRTQVRENPEPVTRVPVVTEPERVVTPPAEKGPAVKKPEVRSAMKVAMKTAMRPLATPPARPPARKEVPEHSRRPVVEPAENPEPPRKYREEAREPVREPVRERVYEPEEYEPPSREEPAGVPQFCHNCGKKLPLEANFCPGCGTRLGQSRTLTNARMPLREKRTLPADTVIPDRKPVPPPRAEEEPDEDDEIGAEKPQPTRPPIKKAPKGSEMTILHKFLRR